MSVTKFGYFDKNLKVVYDAEIDLHEVPSSDPLAFSFGLVSGKRARGMRQEDKSHKISHGSIHRELAPEYLRGFLAGYMGFLVPEGTKIRKGEEQSFSLYHLKITRS